MIANLHSLLNRGWYIEQRYAEAQLPLLFNILNGASVTTPEAKKPILKETNSNNTTTSDKKVVVMDIKDPIYKYDQECGPYGTQTRMAMLDALKNNNDVAGVVLDIDSGGGQVSGTPEFYDYIKNYPKPIVAYTGGYMCSAAYYIGSAADEVIANPRAEAIGSIGAYIQFLDLTGYFEKQGATLHTIYATQSTEKNKAYREALEGNYDAMVKEELDPIVDDFINDMKSAMPNISDKAFKGATFAGPMAKELNLVNSLGNLQDAIDKVLELSEVNSNSNLNNSQMNTKERPNVQAVLELDGPMASNDNGVYLNDAQLDVIEETLATNAANVASAQEAQQTAEDALAQEQQAMTDFSAQLNNLALAAGVEKGANNAETFTALQNRITELSKEPGDVHTTIKKENEPDAKYPYIDFSSPIYQQN
jgi:protease-4